MREKERKEGGKGGNEEENKRGGHKKTAEMVGEDRTRWTHCRTTALSVGINAE